MNEHERIKDLEGRLATINRVARLINRDIRMAELNRDRISHIIRLCELEPAAPAAQAAALPTPSQAA